MFVKRCVLFQNISDLGWAQNRADLKVYNWVIVYRLWPPYNLYFLRTLGFFCKDLWKIENPIKLLHNYLHFSFHTSTQREKKVYLKSLYNMLLFVSHANPFPQNKWNNWICAFLPGVVGGTSSTTLLLLSVFFFTASVLDSLCSIEFIGKGVNSFNLATALVRSSLDAIRNVWKISST